MDILVLALIASSGLTFTLFKLLGEKTLRYDWMIDITFTVILPILFSGSFAGMTLALLTGIFLSLQLFAIKKIYNLIRKKSS